MWNCKNKCSSAMIVSQIIVLLWYIFLKYNRAKKVKFYNLILLLTRGNYSHIRFICVGDKTSFQTSTGQCFNK